MNGFVSSPQSYHTAQVQTDATDWPIFLDATGRAWLMERLRTVHTGPMSMFVLVDRVFDCARSQRPSCLASVTLLDAQYACVERALRAMGAELVWTPRVSA